MIPISAPVVDAEAERLVLEVLRSGRLAQGPMVERFEYECARMAGTAYAVAMSNGTVTLQAALLAHGVGPGDEVITTPLTFAATVNAIRSVGATPVFADIGDDWCLDPVAVVAAVTDRTAAVLPVHLYGQPATLPAVNVPVIEDCAQAHGAPVGRTCGSFSFYATKNAHCGEGGVVTTDDPQVAEWCRLWRNQGMDGPYNYRIAGTNARMTELQAAVGVASLARLKDRNRRRRANAAELLAGLKGLDLTLPTDTPGHVWHQFTVLADDRDALKAGLAERGVEARVYYPAVLGPGCPNAEHVAAHCLSLPVHDRLSYSELDHIVASVRVVLGA